MKQKVKFISAFKDPAIEARKNIVRLKEGISPFRLQCMHYIQDMLEEVSEWLGAEPPPRRLSPIVFDEKNKVFVLIGGDHLDYLMNDTWLFDPATKKWRCTLALAPPPRANHTLKAANGKIVMSGGYTYTSNTDYMGGQYRDLADGDWTFDVNKEDWIGGKGIGADPARYPEGPFHPDFYLKGDRPDAAAWAAKLKELPANTWTRRIRRSCPSSTATGEPPSSMPTTI